MNIELRFLQKAIEDGNYISFSYEQKEYKKVLAIKLVEEENTYLLHTKEKTFEANKINKLIILKDRV